MSTTDETNRPEPSTALSEDLPRHFSAGDLVIDVATRTITRDGVQIELPNLSWLLLLALARRWPAVVSQSQLFDELWPDVVVSEEALTQRVKLLRQALDDDSRNPRYVRTVRSAGYALAVEVTPVEPAPRRQTVNRPWKPILSTILALAALAGAAAWWQRSHPQAPPRTSVAVLPFTNSSPSESAPHVAAALQEELWHRLDALEVLDLAPRSTLRRAGESLAELGERVGVTTLIEGSVSQSPEALEVEVRLLDSTSGDLLWQDTLASEGRGSPAREEGSIPDLAEIQAELAERIAGALRVELSESDRASLSRLPTSNLDAYNAYLLGRYHTFKLTTADLERGIEFLERAVALDPEFAEAYATLAWGHSFLGTSYGSLPPERAYRRAKEAALRALALDGDLADARAVYADILAWYDWDWPAAEREYQTTLRLEPDNVLSYAVFLSAQQRHDEALALIEGALEQRGDDAYFRVNAAWRYFHARRYDRAIAEARLAEEHSDAAAVLGNAHLARGDIDEAIEIFEASVERTRRSPHAVAELARAYAAKGRTEDARALLEEMNVLSREKYFSPAILAGVHFALGQVEEGFDRLEHAHELRTREIFFLQVDHASDSVREHPRYLRLLEAMAFQTAGQ